MQNQQKSNAKKNKNPCIKVKGVLKHYVSATIIFLTSFLSSTNVHINTTCTMYF